MPTFLTEPRGVNRAIHGAGRTHPGKLTIATLFLSCRRGSGLTRRVLPALVPQRFGNRFKLRRPLA